MKAQGKELRPVWRGMGLWKWPSIALILFCIAVIVPYAERGGGASGMGSAPISLLLHDCPIEFELHEGKQDVTIVARLAPACAIKLSRPTVEFLNADGALIAQAPMRGDPNSLRASVDIENSRDTEERRIRFVARHREGGVVHVEALLRQELIQSERQN